MKDERYERLRTARLWLIDLDGTLIRGGQALPGADVLIQTLRRAERNFLILTNNATRTPRAIARDLSHLGLDIEEDEVYTSPQALVDVLVRERPSASVLAIGEEGLLEPLKRKGFRLVEDWREADTVCVGLDRSLCYDALARAALALQHGAQFYATNVDLRLPVEDGFHPGNGSIVRLLEGVSGKAAEVIGKPRPAMLQAALARFGASPDDALMLGDSLETDIPAASELGMLGVLVRTGVSAAVKEGEIRAHTPLLFDDLPALLAYLGD
ncbi:MAG: HAD-IIA family hydrolase [Candidatus Carbobacillus altaicus]|nr:HAD-IIA family hydrolase [Candidatus Carbobacillus altaicus]